MLADEDIAAAVSAGLLDAQQGERLAAFLASRRARPQSVAPDPDDERFRLIGGFNDVFVFIGIVLVCGALAILLSAYAAPAIMLAAWGMSEIFTARRRMALPSIALALLFAGGAAFAGVFLTTLLIGPVNSPFTQAIAGLFAMGAALIHFRRFRVAIDVAIAVGALCCALIALVLPATGDVAPALFAVVGLLCFGLAMRYDLADPERLTLNADIAFWLHLLAAPFIVHGTLSRFFVSAGLEVGPAGLGVFWALILVYFAVAVLIDRRAIIVSSLAYVLTAAAFVLKGSLAIANSATASALVGGLLVLGLSVWWRPLRARLLAMLPTGGLRDRLPPVAPG